MLDQANDLRKLARHSAAPSGRQAPGLLVVAGGKGGVGTTTVAILLAAALGRRRLRTLLIDAARSGDAAVLCGLQPPHHNLADVLSGRATLIEATQSGPGNLRIVPGAWAGDGPADPGPHAADRLLAQLTDLGAATDVVVLDAGNDPGRLAQRCWSAARGRLVVTTPETAAIVETYAAIKRLSPPGNRVQWGLAPSERGAVPIFDSGLSTCWSTWSPTIAQPTRPIAAWLTPAVASWQSRLNLIGHVKKTKKGLNLNRVPADNKGELSVFDVLLNYADYMKFNGNRGTHLWHELTPVSSAPWHS